MKAVAKTPAKGGRAKAIAEGRAKAIAEICAAWGRRGMQCGFL